MTDDTVVQLRPKASADELQRVADEIPPTNSEFDAAAFRDALPDLLAEVVALLMADHGYQKSDSNSDSAIRILTAIIDRLGVDDAG